MRSLAVLSILLLALSGGVREIHASPVNPAEPRGQQGQQTIGLSYVSKQVFSLPLLLDPSVASSLSKVELYVRKAPSDPWKLVQAIKPTERAFVIKANGDGEYQFAVVGVDRQGRKTVPDLSRKSPDSVICVDSQPPRADVRFAGDSAEGMEFTCTSTDANPQPLATEFYYQTQDGQWRRVLPSPDQANRYCVPHVAALTGMIKVVEADRAGNKSTHETNLTQLRPGNGSASTRMPYADRGQAGDGPAIFTGQQSMQQYSTAIGTQGEGSVMADASSIVPPPFPVPQQVAPLHASSPMPQMTTESDPLSISPPQPPVPLPPPHERPPVPAPVAENGPPLPIAAAENFNQETFRVPSEKIEAPGRSMETRMLPLVDGRQFVNRPHVFLAYEVEQGTNAAAAKIQVWLSSDHGKSWIHAGEDADGISPVEVHLPAEGVTGIRLMAGNQRPTDADMAHPEGLVSWIELDVTRPTVDMNVRREGNEVLVPWHTRDKNQSPEPVDLYYAFDRNGPWTSIAAGLSPSGEYRWEIPIEVGNRPLHIGLVAHDAAGNTGSAVQPAHGNTGQTVERTQPTQTQTPRVRFLGVSSQSPHGAPVTPTRYEDRQPPSSVPLP